MRRLLVITALVLALPSVARTQEGAAAAPASAPAPRRITIGADAALALPLGTWYDSASLGLGLFARGEYALRPHLSIVVMPGFLLHLSRSVDFAGTPVDYRTSELLLLAGARLYLGPVFVTALTGLNDWTVSAGDKSSSHGRVPLYLGGGYLLRGKIDLGAGLLIPNLLLPGDHEDVAVGILVHGGYNFMAL